MTTTPTQLTADELREQIEAQETNLTEAEREIGVATLDGQSSSAATKRAQAARDSIKGLEGALDELQRRDTECADREAEAAVAARLRRSYNWAAGYFRIAARGVAAHSALQAAEKELAEYTHGARADGPIATRRTGLGRGRFDSRMVDRLDDRIVGGIPSGPQGTWIATDAEHLIGKYKANQRGPADYERLAALADELAAAEGDGFDDPGP